MLHKILIVSCIWTIVRISVGINNLYVLVHETDRTNIVYKYRDLVAPEHYSVYIWRPVSTNGTMLSTAGGCSTLPESGLLILIQTLMNDTGQKSNSIGFRQKMKIAGYVW